MAVLRTTPREKAASARTCAHSHTGIPGQSHFVTCLCYITFLCNHIEETSIGIIGVKHKVEKRGCMYGIVLHSIKGQREHLLLHWQPNPRHLGLRVYSQRLCNVTAMFAWRQCFWGAAMGLQTAEPTVCTDLLEQEMLGLSCKWRGVIQRKSKVFPSKEV